jgi:uncharacterized small protein (DUF1192 family)
MMEDEERPQKREDVVLGADLAMLSIDELAKRITFLEAEIDRIRQEISNKTQSKSDAEGFFKS